MMPAAKALAAHWDHVARRTLPGAIWTRSGAALAVLAAASSRSARLQ